MGEETERNLGTCWYFFVVDLGFAQEPLGQGHRRIALRQEATEAPGIAEVQRSQAREVWKALDAVVRQALVEVDLLLYFLRAVIFRPRE